MQIWVATLHGICIGLSLVVMTELFSEEVPTQVLLGLIQMLVQQVATLMTTFLTMV